MSLNDILNTALREQELKKIEEEILSYGVNSISCINDILSYVINSGGKRLRPLLTLITCDLFEYKNEEKFWSAAAIELIHSSTLLHDDVIDESELRRGRHTVNKIWDNKVSILMGDFCLGAALQLIVKCNNFSIIRILSSISSILAEGELRQLNLKNKFSYDEYFSIITAKTATLFGASCEISGALARAPAEHQKALQNFGFHFGVAFQIVDDYLDYFGKADFGKVLGGDFFNSKVTLPVILSYTTGDSVEKTFWEEVMSEAEDKFNHQHYEKAIGYMQKNNVPEQCRKVAKKYVDIAATNLEMFSNSPPKAELQELLKFILQRCE